MTKPPIGDIYNLNFPEDKENPRLLKDWHPGIVTRNNDDNTPKVVGCTGTFEPGRIKVETDKNMEKDTYANVSQGERNFNNECFTNRNKWNRGTKCTNLQDILDRL